MFQSGKCIPGGIEKPRSPHRSKPDSNSGSLRTGDEDRRPRGRSAPRCAPHLGPPGHNPEREAVELSPPALSWKSYLPWGFNLQPRALRSSFARVAAAGAGEKE